MAKVLFSGDLTSEQAVGSTLDNSVMQMFLVRRDRPREYIFLGGHRIVDASTYITTAGVVSAEYCFIHGRNRVVERQLTFDTVKSISFTLMLPNRMISVTDRIFALQAKCDYDLLLVPNDCGDGCDEFFWFGEDVTLGARQITNSIVGYDENQAPITSTRNLTVTGQLRMYAGKELKTLTPSTGGVALHAVTVVDDSNGSCQGCDCPYQTIYRGGVGLVEVSTDGGNSWTAIDTAALAADIIAGFIVTSLDYKDGRLIIGYSDVANATGTDGGVAYSVDNGAAILSTHATANLGVQDIFRAFGKIYAVGTGGDVDVSCDNGVSFTDVAQAVSTETIIDAVYDSSNNIVHLVGANGSYFTYDGSTFADETANLNAGAVDLLSVAVSDSKTVWIGAGNGNLYTNDSFEGGDTDWVISTNVTNAVGAIATDISGFELYFGESAELHRLSGLTCGEPESFNTTVTGNLSGSYVPTSSSDEFSSDVFHFVSDDGSHYVIQSCALCVSTSC
jgi:hypothetical protein